MATSGPQVAASTSRAGLARALLAATFLLSLFLTGCSASTPTPAPTANASSPSPPTATPSGGGPSGGSTGWTAGGPSFGVDRAAWPRTVKDAERLLQALPATFEGFTRKIARPPGETGEFGESGPSAGATFGDQRSVIIAQAFTTTETEDGKPTTMSADKLLAANFLLVMTCAEGSYQGTARPEQGGIGPSVRGKAGQGSVWFSCRVAGAEGNEDFAAHVVGWTSGKTAWQVLAPDEESLRSLVTAIRTAGG